MSEWREIAVQDLCTRVTSGGTPSRKRSDFYVEHGIPWVKSKELVGAQIRSTEEQISEEGLRRSSAKLLPPGSVLLAMYGANIGQLGWLGIEASVNQAICAMVTDPEQTDARFLYYSLAGARASLAGNAHGAAQQNLSQQLIKSFKLSVPDLSTQRFIGGTLRSIDDLIENNRRRVEVLEEMARSIYHEWFVKFRYPGHEEVSMVDSSLGEIPEGWEVGRVDSFVLLQRGYDLPVKARQPGLIPVLGASGVQGSHQVAKVEGPGVTTGRSGTIGTVNYAPYDFWPLNTCLWVREFRLATPRFAYFMLTDLDLKRSASGAAVPTLDRKVVHQLPAVCPPAALVERWDREVSQILESAEALRMQSNRLEEIRDLLLPKLVTGQIDVSNTDLTELNTPKLAGVEAVA